MGYKFLAVSIVLLSSFLFLGCSKKSTVFEGKYQKSNQYFKYLQNVQIKKLLNDKEDGKYVKATVWVAYLNSIENNYSPNDLKNDPKLENFLISVYYSDQNDDLGYSFSLNDTTFESITKLEKNDPRLKDLALHNKWADYYLYKFKKVDDMKSGSVLNLKFNPNQDKNSLNFKFIKVD